MCQRNRCLFDGLYKFIRKDYRCAQRMQNQDRLPADRKAIVGLLMRLKQKRPESIAYRSFYQDGYCKALRGFTLYSGLYQRIATGHTRIASGTL